MWRAGVRLRKRLARGLRRLTAWPPVGTVRFGGLRRLAPVSDDWGFERGRPVDRYYIEAFLSRHARDVAGRTLEIDVDTYTRRFGGDRVRRSDVLSLTGEQPGTTLVGDLARGEELPSATFDCAIVTQTFQLIYDVRAAAETLHRMLRPGGVALLTVPGIAKTTGDREGRWGSQWSFTSLSARRLFEETFAGGSVEVTSYGNVLAAVAFLHGLAAEELTREELEHRDPAYEVVVAVRARKAGGEG